MSGPRIWTLDSRSYSGIVAGARHWHGDLRSDLHRLTVQWKVDRAGARDLSTPDFAYEVGWESERFSSREDLRKAASVAWASVADVEGGDLLLEGDYASAEPERVLAGVGPLREGAEALYARVAALEAQSRDPWRDHPAEMDAVMADWDALKAEHGVERDRSGEVEKRAVTVERVAGVWRLVRERTRS